MTPEDETGKKPDELDIFMADAGDSTAQVDDKENAAQDGSEDGNSTPESPPPDFPFVCPECGEWKSKKGKPYTQGGLNFHRMNVHGYRKDGGKPDHKPMKKPSEPAPVPVAQPAAPEPDSLPDAALFSEEAFEENQRTKNLRKALSANTFLDQKERDFIINYWNIHKHLREDERDFLDFLMRLPKMAKHPDWANDIVDITFYEEPYYDSYSRSRGRTRQRGRGRSMPPERYPRRRDPYGREDRYGDRGRDRRYDDYPPDHYERGPPRGGGISEWEMEDRMRRERREWQREQEMKELKRTNLALQQQMQNQQQAQQPTMEQLIEQVMVKVAAAKGGGNSEELKELRDKTDRLLMELKDAQTKTQVQQATDPLVRELQNLKAHVANAQTQLNERSALKQQLQQEGIINKGLGDEAQVAVEEIKAQTSQFTQMAGNLNNTINSAIGALMKLSQPVGQNQPQTSGMNENEMGELQKIADGE